ncbi:TadE family type IV pilus minor pilin [Dactylosporangium matsuzakiense]|uniref:TadE-like protein n=1 Tax=Dactylosporangium matsuzakiense TaxID=53360 RepID=A0A9W6NIG9_9ACTN|nr:TadE family type IV pilus minor pilin [Dactylosporangium matsuzakiense]UWZ45188.1 mucin-associated surface protein [Dactylosporangium matsuzakiense]GLK98854.1 hypothetical protein GCM10017581_005950 [Dactylosporangium matsuzakiense]
MTARGRAAVRWPWFVPPDSPTTMPVPVPPERPAASPAGAAGPADRPVKVRRRQTGARHRRERTGRDRGSAALEVAIALPVILLFLVSGILLLGALGAKIVAADGAGAAARAAARGEPLPTLSASSDVTVTRDGDLVRVTVRQPVVNPIGADLHVEETAVAMAEPR